MSCPALGVDASVLSLSAFGHLLLVKAYSSDNCQLPSVVLKLSAAGFSTFPAVGLAGGGWGFSIRPCLPVLLAVLFKARRLRSLSAHPSDPPSIASLLMVVLNRGE